MVSAEQNLLDPDAIARGEVLGLMARRVVEGYRVGEHRSPFRGFAIEFAQHREYTAGDDIRHLDWKVLGRSDRYYIKQYEQDTNFVAHIVLDGSASMNYASERLSKLQFAKALSACLAYLILLQRDAVALAVADAELREYMPRTDNVGRIHPIMHRLSSFVADGKTDLARIAKQVSHQARGRGIFLILSDAFDDEAGLTDALRRLHFAGHEVIFFHVLDPFERTFPFTGTWKLRGLEEALEIQTSPADIRRSYLKNFEEFCGRVRAACECFQAHYVVADTGRSLGAVLSEYLAFRRSLGKRR
jgi:uncharacterized protein (DUF58 family)